MSVVVSTEFFGGQFKYKKPNLNLKVNKCLSECIVFGAYIFSAILSETVDSAFLAVGSNFLQCLMGNSRTCFPVVSQSLGTDSCFLGSSREHISNWPFDFFTSPRPVGRSTSVDHDVSVSWFSCFPNGVENTVVCNRAILVERRVRRLPVSLGRDSGGFLY